MTKLRKYRTLTEMLVDAHTLVRNPHRSLATGRISHPDKPKKPMTPYLRFYMEKRAQFQAENPDLTNVELSKFVAARFAELSEKKRAKYRRKYDRQMAEYKDNLDIFRVQHPDLFKKTKPVRVHVGPEKARRPIDFYSASRMKKYADEDPKVAQEKIRESWENLSDEKKLKWIRKAIVDGERFDSEVVEYAKEHSDFKPPKKRSNVSKSELDLKYKSEGRPEKPPTSGYLLFSKTVFNEFSHLQAKEKMAAIAAKWKELTDEERTKYNEKVKKIQAKYFTKFETFLDSLPEEEKVKIIGEKKPVKVAEKKQKPKMVRPAMVQNSARLAYQVEEMHRLKKIYPNKVNGELIITVNKNWDDLGVEGQQKYVALAESLNEFMPGLGNSVEHGTKTSGKSNEEKEFTDKSGIKRPPKNGFALFCSETMASMESVPPKERMKKIADIWKNQMGAEDRDAYVKRAKEKCDAFVEQFNKYKQTGQTPPRANNNEKASNVKKDKTKNAKQQELATTRIDKIPNQSNQQVKGAHSFLYKDSSDDSD